MIAAVSIPIATALHATETQFDRESVPITATVTEAGPMVTNKGISINQQNVTVKTDPSSVVGERYYQRRADLATESSNGPAGTLFTVGQVVDARVNPSDPESFKLGNDASRQAPFFIFMSFVGTGMLTAGILFLLLKR